MKNKSEYTLSEDDLWQAVVLGRQNISFLKKSPDLGPTLKHLWQFLELLQAGTDFVFQESWMCQDYSLLWVSFQHHKALSGRLLSRRDVQVICWPSLWLGLCAGCSPVWGHLQHQTAWGGRRSVPRQVCALPFLYGFLLTIANRSCLNSSLSITAIIKDCARYLTEVHGLHTNEGGTFSSQTQGKSFRGSCVRNSSWLFPDC